MPFDLLVYAVLAVLVVGLLISILKILREYERGIIFTLGRFSAVKGPGIVIVVPFVQQMVRVDLRTIVLDVPSQDVISRDNVSAKVNAVLYFRVVDPDKAVVQVVNFMEATSQLAQTTLRSVLGKHDLDEMLSERDKLNADLQDILDSQTDAWGIKVANVEIKHVDIDESMVRAIARQAEAERNRRARVINAEGEHQAAERLTEAATTLASVPEAMQLRYLSTLYDIAGDKNSTIVFPFPIDLVRQLGDTLRDGQRGAGPTREPPTPSGRGCPRRIGHSRRREPRPLSRRNGRGWRTPCIPLREPRGAPPIPAADSEPPVRSRRPSGAVARPEPSPVRSRWMAGPETAMPADVRPGCRCPPDENAPRVRPPGQSPSRGGEQK